LMEMAPWRSPEKTSWQLIKTRSLKIGYNGEKRN
jgi:hypothetical protein